MGLKVDRLVDDALRMSISEFQLDALPIVSDPGMVAANDGLGRRTSTTLGELVAALADEADAVSDSAEESDALVAAAVFGLQWSLKRAESPAAGAAASDLGSTAPRGSGRAA